DSAAPHGAFERITGFLENSPRRRVRCEGLSKYAKESMGGECPLSDESEGLGCNAASPMRCAEPITDLGASPIDVSHELKADAAHSTTLNDHGQRARWVDRSDAAYVSLGISEPVRMGEEVT